MTDQPPQPHERPEFSNQATYRVAVTYTVAGGARRATAERRAERAAERIANAAARLGDVVDVTAAAGRDVNGEVVWPRPVHFSAANSGQGTHGQPGKLARYLDPEHERALASLAKANAEHRARQEADRKRRLAVSCRNPYGPSAFVEHRACGCVYCQPRQHCWAVEGEREAPGHWSNEHRCLCGQRVAAAGERCTRHREAALVVLDGDPDELGFLADQQRDRQSPSEPSRPRPPERDEPDQEFDR